MNFGIIALFLLCLHFLSHRRRITYHNHSIGTTVTGSFLHSVHENIGLSMFGKTIGKFTRDTERAARPFPLAPGLALGLEIDVDVRSEEFRH